MVPSLRRAV